MNHNNIDIEITVKHINDAIEPKTIANVVSLLLDDGLLFELATVVMKVPVLSVFAVEGVLVDTEVDCFDVVLNLEVEVVSLVVSVVDSVVLLVKLVVVIKIVVVVLVTLVEVV